MTEQWQELKKIITELRDNNGTGTQQEVCKFLANLMDNLEKQMQHSSDIFSRGTCFTCKFKSRPRNYYYSPCYTCRKAYSNYLNEEESEDEYE